MPQRMMDKEEERLCLGQDLEFSKELELGVLPRDVQMEEVGQWVMWGLSQYWHRKAHPWHP